MKNAPKKENSKRPDSFGQQISDWVISILVGLMVILGFLKAVEIVIGGIKEIFHV